MRNGMAKGAVVGLLLGAVLGMVPMAAATAGESDAVAVRQAMMKELGAHMRNIGAFLRGAGTAADVAQRGQSIAAAAAKMPALFPEGSGIDDLGLARTGAKATIWQRWEDFESAAQTLRQQAMAFTLAAQTGERGRIGAAMGALGRQGCAGCHRDFRQKR